MLKCCVSSGCGASTWLKQRVLPVAFEAHATSQWRYKQTQVRGGHIYLPVAPAGGPSSAPFPSSCAGWEGNLRRCVPCTTSFRASIWPSLLRRSVRVSLSWVFSWKISLSFWVTSAWESLSCCFSNEISPDFWQTWDKRVARTREACILMSLTRQTTKGIQFSPKFPAV